MQSSSLANSLRAQPTVHVQHTLLPNRKGIVIGGWKITTNKVHSRSCATTRMHISVLAYRHDTVDPCLPSALNSLGFFLFVAQAFVTFLRCVTLSVSAVQRGSVGRDLRQDARAASGTGRSWQ